MVEKKWFGVIITLLSDIMVGETHGARWHHSWWHHVGGHHPLGDEVVVLFRVHSLERNLFDGRIMGIGLPVHGVGGV